jgi:hypothetical protein
MARKFLNDIDLKGKLLINTSGGTDGYFLKTDGTGVISWAAAGSGSLGYVGSFQTTSSAGSTISLTVPSVSSGSGNTISIQAGTNTGSVTGANGGAVTITGGSQTNASALRTGGSVTISGGTSGANGTGGTVYINGGVGGANGNGTVNIGTTGTDSISLLAPTLVQSPIWLTTAGNAGTKGQVLTSAGSGATPAWSSPLAVPRPTGDYYTSTSYTTATGSGGTSITLLSYIPVYLPAIQTITSLGVWVSSVGNSSNVLGFGLYSNSTSNKPETKLLDGGTVTSINNSSVNSVSGLSYTLPSAGWYWVALQLVSTPTTASTYALATSSNIPGSSSSFIMPNATSPTTMNTHYTQTITSGQALPATAGTLNTSTAGAPKVYVGV